MTEFPFSQGGSGGEGAQKSPGETAEVNSTILMGSEIIPCAPYKETSGVSKQRWEINSFFQ